MELYDVFQTTFKALQDKMQTSYSIKLANQIGVTRDVIMNIENGARNGKN